MFKSERTYDMSPFGWEGCTFTFKALTFGEQRELDSLRQKWQISTDQKEVEAAALKVLDIIKKHFVRGQAINEAGNKVDVRPADFESEIPFDIFLKIVAWVTANEVDEAFLVKSTK